MDNTVLRVIPNVVKMKLPRHLNIVKKLLHTFNVLSHDPVIRQVYDGALTQWQVFTGAS